MNVTFDITGEQFILNLCNKTQLNICKEVAKEFKSIISNANKYRKYHYAIGNTVQKGNQNEAGLFQFDDKDGKKITKHIKDTVNVLNVIDGDKLTELEEEFKQTTSKDQFEKLLKMVIKQVPKPGANPGWWKKIKQFGKTIWDTIADIFNVVWKGAKTCLKDWKCLTFLLVVLWIVYCWLYGTTTETIEGGWSYMMPVAMPVYRQTQNISHTNTPCAMTWNLLDYIRTFFQELYNTIVNGFQSLFGANNDYILPQQINYVENAEMWDYVLYKQGTNVLAGSICGGASYAAGVGGGLVAGGVTLPAGLAVGGTALLLGSLCVGLNSTFNTAVISSITKEQYLQYERLLLRPLIIGLEQEIVRFSVKNLKKEQKETVLNLNKYFLRIADVVAGVRAFTVNLGNIIKTTYGKALVSGAIATFTTAKEKAADLNGYYKKKLEMDKQELEMDKKELEMKQEAQAAMLMLGSQRYFQSIQFDPNNKEYLKCLNNMDKLLILIHCRQIQLIEDKEWQSVGMKTLKRKPEKLNTAFDKHLPKMKMFFKDYWKNKNTFCDQRVSIPEMQPRQYYLKF